MFDTDLDFETTTSVLNGTQVIETIFTPTKKTNDVSFEAKFLPFPEQAMDFDELEAILDE